jgi:hypothetical protein
MSQSHCSSAEGGNHSSKEEQEARFMKEVTLRFVSSKKSQVFTCAPDDQEILSRRSEYFSSILTNNEKETIEIPEEDAVHAINFLTEILKNKPLNSLTLGWDQSWVMFSAKWQAGEYVAVFADIADKHIKSVVGDMEEKGSPPKSIYFHVDGDDKGIYNMKVLGNKIYDATDEKNKYGVTIYQQRDDHNKVIEYWEPTKSWIWKTREILGTNRCNAREEKPLQREHPDIKTVTQVTFATGKPAPDDWSKPFKVIITPIAPPAAPEPSLPSSVDVELFWMMCEAILQFPALAKADGLIKSKEDLMAVLLKKRHLVEYRIMEKLFSIRDVFQIVFGLEYSSNKRSR